ncbi:MAG: hypothetical protein NT069_17065 [Planctomycetota bacterium]|nr:hypothetical protein [Planctomycetota bacterium]
MNSWSTLAAPVRNLLAQMPTQWRYALFAAGVACVVAGGWLWSQEDATADKPLFGGKVFVAAELRTAQGTLKQAGVSGLRVSGGRIFVPADQCARCESLLSHDANGKSSFGDHYEKALSQSAWPVSESHRQELMDSARANELIEMFKADPNIADARLMWNRAKRRTFSNEGRTTAVLGITPRAGKAVSPELAESLKTAVASAFGLASADDVRRHRRKRSTPCMPPAFARAN